MRLLLSTLLFAWLYATSMAYSQTVDYPSALPNFTTCNYNVGRTTSIDTWVNHWIGTGTYAGAISWFLNCSSGVSAHFVIRASDGQISQIVKVANTAWHCGANGYPLNNPRSIGVEHDATVTNPSNWNSLPMLQSSTNMACYFTNLYSIPRTQSLPGIRGHNDMPGTSTQCPGNLPWSTWMSMLNSNCSQGSTPSNNNCNNAIQLNSNVTCNYTNGSIANATQSLPPSNCSGYTSSAATDVWYRFTATHQSHTITLSPSSGLDAVLELRNGCTGSLLQCVDQGGGLGGNETLNYSSFTNGTQYYVRVYAYYVNFPPTTHSFQICVTHTPCQSPSQPGQITGSASVCAGTTQSYCIPSVSGATSYSWTYSGGGTPAGSSTCVTLSPTSSGTLSVVATNSCGNSSPSTFIINVEPVPSQPGSITGITNICSGGSGSYCIPSVSGATSYTWSFSGGGNPVGAGTCISLSPTSSGLLSVVANNSCGSSTPRTLNISTSPIPSANAGTDVTINHGGSVQLTGSGGGSCSWAPTIGLDNPNSCNPIASPSHTTTYTLTVTDGTGCTASSQVTVTVSSPNCENSTASLSQVNVNLDSVAGSATVQVTFNPQGPSCSWTVAAIGNCTPWLNYQPGLPQTSSGPISINADVNSTGVTRVCTLRVTSGLNHYDIIVQQAGASAPCTPPLPKPTLAWHQCELSAVLISGVTYQWYKGNDPIGGNSRFLSVTQSGYYYVVIEDSRQCREQSSDIYVQFNGPNDCTIKPVGIKAQDNLNSLKLYPNPTQGLFALNVHLIQAVEIHVQIVNIQGQVVLDATSSGPTDSYYKEFDIELPSGLYIVNVMAGEEILSRKLVIQR